MEKHQKAEQFLNSPLPRTVSNLQELSGLPLACVEKTIKESVRERDRGCVEAALKWNFSLGKTGLIGPKRKQKQRRAYLTRKQRRALNLLTLPPTGYNHCELEQMRELWKGYMRENLEHMKNAPSFTDSAWSAFGITLGKSEFIGAEFTVIKSRVPSVIGISGTVVLETRSTFQLVTRNLKRKIVLKEPSVFTFTLDNVKFTFLGKYVITRPADRSVKKIKLMIMPDI